MMAGAGVALTGLAGCLDRIPGLGLDTEFETVDGQVSVDDPPEVTVDDDTVTARGTIQYGSSRCGTVDLAHANYERSQHRLDLLVVAADDSRWRFSCTDDLVATGYRVEATAPDDLRRVSVTEHHVFGKTYSTTVDLTDW
ncbi:hypothetical protein SAMN04489842_1946 [Natronobacterium texcoconense]|uniref:Uncharacterized protein n=2 Tax=Natronobacterium texcoconense TaxID=1095778 RepID=A0A1H1FF74_NATTX|nr:hypothetical protein SAMN04489842_1946 [Natronobacterium texcoconense]